MRGSPIFRLAVAAFFLVLAGIPIWHLTRPVVASAAVPDAAPDDGTREVVLKLSSVPTAQSLTVLLLGKPISLGGDGVIRLPREATDLVVKGQWADAEGSCAVRVLARQDSLDLLDATLWGQGEIEDVVTIPVP
ncbi:MAG: hypothetical protein ACOYNN_00560 [Terrimicrobiaceae bacterium]